MMYMLLNIIKLVCGLEILLRECKSLLGFFCSRAQTEHVVFLIEDDQERQRQLGWTLGLATYCMHVLSAAVGAFCSVCAVVAQQPMKGINGLQSERREIFSFLKFIHLFPKLSLSSHLPLVAELLI